ncbi:MAG TPA: polysaccharide biosynthesis tyrosine autokinase [Myxococcales bacterium]|nr:polysaccharide biosynthesis tyrosine autokinase [Myxococcales bacterium]HIN86220.1 polysaccharide biosynthesis tyrosine autokinase [Myxococcales bacterium]
MDKPFDAPEGFSADRFFAILRRWWWLVVTIVCVTIGVSYAILDRVSPRYRATATVVVSPKSPRVIADIQEFVELPGGSRRDFRAYVETQLGIIKSQRVSEIVLDELNLWDDERLFKSAEPKEKGLEEAVSATELRLKRANLLSKRIKARRVPDSLTLEIQFEHSDPVLAAQVSNSVAAAYVSQNLDLKREVLSEARVDLKKLLVKRKISKEAAETSARIFEKEQDITAVGTRRKEVAGERSFYNEKVLEATSKVVRTEAELAEIKMTKRKGLFGVGGGAANAINPVLSELKVQAIKFHNEVSEYRLIYGKNHNKLIGAKARLSHVLSAASKEIKGLYRNAKARHEAAVMEKEKFDLQFESARKEDEALSSAVEEYKKLQKELNEQTALYDRIRKRYEETIITTSLAANNLRLLDYALVPEKPYWPRRGPIMLGSAFLGLLFGIGMAMLLERADTTIRDKTHAEAILKIPCLGLVPTIPIPSSQPGLEGIQERDLYVHAHPLSEPAEHARTLRTNLLFLSAERQLKTLLVTSPLPEEGKTTIAIQTCIALASAGGRTILVEADMRRPRLAETLSLKANIGLSTFLANRETEIQDIIQASAIPNLDVIPCGLIPPNPAELLNSLRLNQLIVKLQEKYDMIIVDSPPINAVSDALVMASRVDGVLLVAKAKQTTSEAVKSAYRALHDVDAPVIGTVLNDLQKGYFGYYRKGYYRKGYYRKGGYHRQETLDAVEAAREKELASVDDGSDSSNQKAG